MQNLDEFRQAFDEKIKNLSEEKGLSTVLISRTTINAIVKTGCETRCSCLRAEKLCNSKCHGSLSCKNKTVAEILNS